MGRWSDMRNSTRRTIKYIVAGINLAGIILLIGALLFSSRECAVALMTGMAILSFIIVPSVEFWTSTGKDKEAEHKFHCERHMFYISGNTIINPPEEYQDLSHEEWFKKVGVNIEEVTRGYYNEKDRYIILYTGKDFKIPNISVQELINLFKSYPIDYIGLGVEKGVPGEIWKPKFKLSIQC